MGLGASELSSGPAEPLTTWSFGTPLLKELCEHFLLCSYRLSCQGQGA